MSLLMQYWVLRSVLLQTHRIIQTPSAFALPYSELRVLALLRKIPALDKRIGGSQWTTRCILHNMGLVEMRHGPGWLIAVTPEGAMFMHGLKMQMVKAVCTVLLTAAGGLAGFLFGVTV